jgi:hypothetical protein
MRVGVHPFVFYFGNWLGAASAASLVVGNMTTLFGELVDASGVRCHYQKWQRKQETIAVS